jgi:hypothetical protein
MKYTHELARIKATQKAWKYRKYGRPTQRPEPVSFDQWFLQGIRNFEAKGTEFELLPGMIKITWPGKSCKPEIGRRFQKTISKRVSWSRSNGMKKRRFLNGDCNG